MAKAKAKTLTSNVYVHPDPGTGEGGGWFGPDYPGAVLTDEQAAQVDPSAFAADDEPAPDKE